MPNLGQLGDVVRVKDGYARNFLIPYGKAKRATEAAIAEFQARRAELEKAAVDGRLFGSVTNHDIAAALNAAGLKVEKAQVRMPNGALKIAGEHTVTVALHPDVVVDVKVVVAGEAA